MCAVPISGKRFWNDAYGLLSLFSVCYNIFVILYLRRVRRA